MGFRNMYIAASAGSGKTYQLVNRFIALLSIQQLATGRPEVGRLIAITFSRKAAGEFKERILAALAEAAQSEEQATRFWQERIWPTIADAGNGICPGVPQPDLPPLQEFFTRMLRALTDAFSELKLSTIDSLFHQMVSTLAPELGIHSMIPLDEARQQNLNRRTLDLTYLQHGAGGLAELEAAINDCFPSEDRKDKPDNNVLELVSTYHEAVLNAPEALWGGQADNLSDAELALFGLSRQDVTLRMSPAEFNEATERLYRLIPEGAPANWSEYILSLAHTGGSLAHEPKGGWADFCAVCESKGLDLELLREARRPIYWRRLLSRTRAIHSLIAEFEQRYHADVRSRGFYSFNDVLQLLRGRIHEESMLVIEERTDARLDHWLLDEFQDTSWAQFHVLRDLLINRAAADDGSIFMVGDAKQSIYQFRGGDPHIFIQARTELFGLGVHQLSCEESAQLPLDTSYRSTQPVLDFANELFSDLDGTARNASLSARQLWNELRYHPHQSAPHMAVRPGCAAIYQARRRGNEDQSMTPIEGVDNGGDGNIFRTLAQLLAEKRPANTGRAVPSCAILVNTHAQEKKLYKALSLLQSDFPFEGPLVICNDNEVGEDSPAGKALSQLFRWLNTPGDEKSLSLLRLTPLWEALQVHDDSQEQWAHLHHQLASMGVSGLLRHLSDICPQLTCNDFLRQRFGVWLQAADDFDATGGTLPEWLSTMEKLTVREEPQGNAVRIMTIHKAKGLEFDMLLLPRLSPERDMADATKVNLLQKRDAQGNTIAVLLKPSAEALEKHPEVREALYTPWQAEQEFSSFCNLYVAITRARYATYVIIPSFAPTKGKTLGKEEQILAGLRESESVTGMMLQLAARSHREGEEACPHLDWAERIYLRGEPLWEQAWQLSQHASGLASQGQNEADTPLRFTLPSLTRSTPSGRAAAARSHSAPRPLAYGSRNTGANFGTLVHACFEGIGWLTDGEMPYLPPPRDAEEENAAQTVLSALHAPAVHALFRRPASPCRLYREQGIEALREGKVWVSGQIDRLVVEYADAACREPLRAHIIDFKSDRCEAAALKAEYAPQMREYREMVALAFHLPLEAVTVTLIHAPRQGAPGTLPYAPDEL